MRWCVCVRRDAPVCAWCLRVQRPCRQCGKLVVQRHGDRHNLCRACKHARYYPAAAAAPPPPPSQPPPPLFDSHADLHTPLPLVQRSAIVVLHKQGRTRQDIAQQAGVSQPTVRHWIERYEESKEVDEQTHGRPRCTDEAMDTAIAGAALVETFTSPRQLKRKYEFEPSSRTIDRRLQEAELFGRVARHTFTLTVEHKLKRSFAERYKGWTVAQWERVLFSDESVFEGAGFSGQQWVRRPRGEALSEEYTVDKKPHPVKVNVWGCFCAAGVGYMYVFN
jgi:transposase